MGRSMPSMGGGMEEKGIPPATVTPGCMLAVALAAARVARAEAETEMGTKLALRLTPAPVERALKALGLYMIMIEK